MLEMHRFRISFMRSLLTGDLQLIFATLYADIAVLPRAELRHVLIHGHVMGRSLTDNVLEETIQQFGAILHRYLRVSREACKNDKNLVKVHKHLTLTHFCKIVEALTCKVARLGVSITKACEHWTDHLVQVRGNFLTKCNPHACESNQATVARVGIGRRLLREEGAELLHDVIDASAITAR